MKESFFRNPLVHAWEQNLFVNMDKNLVCACTVMCHLSCLFPSGQQIQIWQTFWRQVTCFCFVVSLKHTLNWISAFTPLAPLLHTCISQCEMLKALLNRWLKKKERKKIVFNLFILVEKRRNISIFFPSVSQKSCYVFFSYEDELTTLKLCKHQWNVKQKK